MKSDNYFQKNINSNKYSQNILKKNKFIFFTILFVFFIINNASSQQKDIIIRISEIEIYPEYVMEYKSILKEEAESSVRLEYGVISIFPMYQKDDTTQIRILEIYANEEAYNLHLKTPHFQKYKITTFKMVKILKLIDMEVIDSKTMLEIFKRLTD